MANYRTLTSFNVRGLRPVQAGCLHGMLLPPNETGVVSTIRSEKNEEQWTVQIYAIETVGVDELADILRRFLAEMDESRIITFEYAHTSSNASPESFGGGAVAVTARFYTVFDTSMVRAQLENICQQALDDDADDLPNPMLDAGSYTYMPPSQEGSGA